MSSGAVYPQLLLLTISVVRVTCEELSKKNNDQPGAPGSASSGLGTGAYRPLTPRGPALAPALGKLPQVEHMCEYI